MVLDVRSHLALIYLDDLGGLFAIGAMVAHSVCWKMLGVGMETSGEVFLIRDALECVADVAYGPQAVSFQGWRLWANRKEMI